MSTAHGEQVRVLEEHGELGATHSLNWWGMIFFISSEALIFANLIAAYLYLEIRSGRWTLPSGDHLDVVYPAFNTIILLGSSVPAILARSGIAKGDKRRLIFGLLGTIIMGSTFLGGQIYEYTNLFGQGFTLNYKTFGSAFFTLTGFHGLHVTIGLIFLAVILIRALRGDFTAKKHFAVEAGEMYWHFVDLVWILVFSTVYLLPLIRG
ncbi:MAG: heme-copper oxidase subunit III [Ktedonobacteraceae bacterium]|jgi:heme/copper-type cytochrome/quinol oxidase subunit 3|nr:heme-copper oxidase subunit III [Ktedonobacteraceae bacterium]